MTTLGLPRLGIGCNAFGSRVDAATVRAIVDTAIEESVAFFDTADVYGFGASETLLGEAIAGRRDAVTITTKYGLWVTEEDQPLDPRRKLDASLTRLGVDFVDLYQLHTPDPNVPIAETLGVLDELVTAGKVRAIGCSNLQAWQLVDADWTSRSLGLARFVTAQNEYSLYNPAAEVELAPACEALGVGILPYFPLAYGLLTGKYRAGASAPSGSRLAREDQAHRLASADWQRIDALQSLADDAGVDLLTLAIGGLASRPAVASVIAGVTRPEQVVANAAAARWAPDASTIAALDAVLRPEQSYTTYAPKRPKL